MAAIGRTLGQVSELTILGKVVPGRVEPLRAALSDLRGRDVFDALGTVHFARWVVLTPDGDQGAAYLLFTSNYDGPLDAYLADLVGRIPDVLAATWGNCQGWPGVVGLEEWTTFVRENAVTASMFFAAYPDASVAEIRRGLRIDTAVQDLLDAMQA